MSDRLRALDVPSPLPLTTGQPIGQAPTPAAERAKLPPPNRPGRPAKS